MDFQSRSVLEIPNLGATGSNPVGDAILPFYCLHPQEVFTPAS